MSKKFSRDPRELRVRGFLAFGKYVSAQVTVSWPYGLIGDDAGHLIYDRQIIRPDDIGDLVEQLRLMVHEMKSSAEEIFESTKCPKGNYRWPRGFSDLVKSFARLNELYEQLDLVVDVPDFRPQILAEIKVVERLTLVDFAEALVVLTARAASQKS